jgi:hypothetical protein
LDPKTNWYVFGHIAFDSQGKRCLPVEGRNCFPVLHPPQQSGVCGLFYPSVLQPTSRNTLDQKDYPVGLPQSPGQFAATDSAGPDPR